MYAVYHGPEGLTRIAERVHALAAVLAAGLRRLGFDLGQAPFFDTLRVRPRGGGATAGIVERARARRHQPPGATPTARWASPSTRR